MEYLITLVFILVATYLLFRWRDGFSEKLIETLKEIGPQVKAQSKENSFSPPAGKEATYIFKRTPIRRRCTRPR